MKCIKGIKNEDVAQIFKIWVSRFSTIFKNPQMIVINEATFSPK